VAGLVSWMAGWEIQNTMIVAHPKTIAAITAQLPKAELTFSNPFAAMTYPIGEQLIADSHIPEFTTKWTGKYLWHRGGVFDFNNEPFIEYEESDLPWLLELGFIKKEMETVRTLYVIKDVMNKFSRSIDEDFWKTP